MLLDDLKQTTNLMKQLEKINTASLYAEKRADSDKNYTKLVSDLYSSLLRAKKGKELLDYTITCNSGNLVKDEISKIECVIGSGIVDEDTLNIARGMNKKTNSSLAKEWGDFFTSINDDAKKKLDSLGPLKYGSDSLNNAKNLLSNAKDWNSLDDTILSGKDRLDMFAQMVNEVKQLEESLDLSKEIKDFIHLVDSKSAKIDDINPTIIEWIHKMKLEDKFVICYKQQ